jgi:hypothetical protein
LLFGDSSRLLPQLCTITGFSVISERMVGGISICEPKLSLTVLDVFNYDFGNDSKSEVFPLVSELLNGINLSEGLLSENHQLHLKIDCFFRRERKKAASSTSHSGYRIITA